MADPKPAPVLRPLAVLAVVSVLSACSTIDPRTTVSVDYYEIQGNSIEELDRQISLHGPKVPGVGDAIASTQVRMMPEVRFGESDGMCRVTRAVIKVQADVTLPRLADRAAVEKSLDKAFGNLQTYARMHEAVHVSIADKYAEEAEKQLRRIPPQESCDSLRREVVRQYDAIMAEHQREQLRFDEEEGKRLLLGDRRSRQAQPG